MEASKSVARLAHILSQAIAKIGVRVDRAMIDLCNALGSRRFSR